MSNLTWHIGILDVYQWSYKLKIKINYPRDYQQFSPCLWQNKIIKRTKIFKNILSLHCKLSLYQIFETFHKNINLQISSIPADLWWFYMLLIELLFSGKLEFFNSDLQCLVIHYEIITFTGNDTETSSGYFFVI